jgi:hypothetical protein
VKRVLAIVVVAVGLLSALGGTASAAGGSGSATACSASSSNVVGTRFLMTLTKNEVDPSQQRFATCTYARKVAEQVVSKEVTSPVTVAGFDCTDFVLKRKPGKNRYHCVRNAGATEISVSFQVVYVRDSRRYPADPGL